MGSKLRADLQKDSMILRPLQQRQLQWSPLSPGQPPSQPLGQSGQIHGQALPERQSHPLPHAGAAGHGSLGGARRQAVPPPQQTWYYNLAGTLDPLVVPSKLIISRKAFWSCWLPHVGHYSILMSQTMWDQVHGVRGVHECLRAYVRACVRVSPPGARRAWDPRV